LEDKTTSFKNIPAKLHHANTISKLWINKEKVTQAINNLINNLQILKNKIFHIIFKKMTVIRGNNTMEINISIVESRRIPYVIANNRV